MILDKIAARTRMRVEARKAAKQLELIRQEALALPQPQPFVFEKALGGQTLSLICEVKKASPSKGVIAADFPYLDIAKEYESAGAAAISVLTEPEFFLGDDRYLEEIKRAVSIPILRKDFTIDEYQIYEAKCLGADAILLICALLDTATLREFINIADSLGLSALVEAHDEGEVRSAIEAGARVIGVNNRNLKDFTVDMQNSLRLRSLVPHKCRFISESGIRTADDIAMLKANGVDAALIGETFMKSSDKIQAIHDLLNEKRHAKLKICGLTHAEDIAAVNLAKPGYAGFVFAPGSRRRVTKEQAKALKAILDPTILAVGVFVNENPEVITELCRENIIDIVQLHGDETEDDIRRIRVATGKKIIRAVRVKTKTDIQTAEKSAADYLLLDTYAPDVYGGTGASFDWNEIPLLTKPFFLAGGISAANAAQAIYRTAPHALDVSSGAETNKSKDAVKIAQITDIVRRITT